MSHCLRVVSGSDNYQNLQKTYVGLSKILQIFPWGRKVERINGCLRWDPSGVYGDCPSHLQLQTQVGRGVIVSSTKLIPIISNLLNEIPCTSSLSRFRNVIISLPHFPPSNQLLKTCLPSQYQVCVEGWKMIDQVHMHRIQTNSKALLTLKLSGWFVKFISNIPTVFHHEATVCLVHRNNLGGITNIQDKKLHRKQLLLQNSS